MTAMVSSLDWDALLAPIAEDRPAGSDPRRNFDPGSQYLRLRDARADARSAERQADAAGLGDDAPAAQWTPVHRLSAELLCTEAKDLEAAAWCTEALLRSDGLAGFTDGCRLMLRLIEAFWDDLHPMPDEDGMASRVAPIAGLAGQSGDGTLIQPLRKVKLFNRRDGSPVALWQYTQSAETLGIADPARREQRIAAGAIPFAELEAEASAAGPTIFARLRNEAAAASAVWQALSDALDARAGPDAPATSRVRDLLGEITDIAGRFAPANVPPATAASVAGDTNAAPPLAGGMRTINTREDALHILDEVAAFFRRTEPHSPLAYTLYDAIRRGRLTWPELLEEIVPDPDGRDAILRSLGIRPLPPPE